MRYIAGENTQSALQVASALQDQGLTSTIDILGEDAVDLAQARRAATDYVQLIDDIARAGVERNISIKLSQLGLRVNQEQTAAELFRVVDAGAARGFFIRLDMEDSSVTDATFEVYRRMVEQYPRVGVVLQARLRRTADDARWLGARQANVRLCKGIYRESAAVAFQRDERIRRAYLETLRVLLTRGAYVGIATHDIHLIERAEEVIAQVGSGPHQVEFQALLGVPMRSTLLRLRDAGYKVRIYLPYGSMWYAYSLRRFEENPKMAWTIAKSLFRPGQLDLSA